MRIILGYLVCILVCTACSPTQIDIPTWRTNYILPLINADFEFQDITLNQKGIIEEDANGAITLVYETPTDTFSIINFIPKLNFISSGSLPPVPGNIDDVFFQEEITSSQLGLESREYDTIPSISFPAFSENLQISEIFTNITFLSGNLRVTVSNNSPLTFAEGINISLNDQRNSVISYTSDQQLRPGETLDISETLAGKTIDNELLFGLSNLKSNADKDITISPDDGFQITISLTDMVLDEALLTFNDFPLPVYKDNIQINLPDSIILKKLAVSGGTIDFTVQQNLPIELKITLDDVTRGPDIFTETLFLNNISSQIDFTNAIFSFPTANTLALNIEPRIIASSDPVLIKFNQEIPFTIEARDFAPTYLEGYFGTFQDILSARLKVDFFDKVRSGKINFTDFSLTINYSSNIGIEGKVLENDSLFLVGKNERLFPDQPVNIGSLLANLLLEKAADTSQFTSQNFLISRNTSDEIEDFVNILPSRIDLSIPLEMGTKTIDTTQYFSKSSILYGSLAADYPVRFSSDDLVIVDTVKFRLNEENQIENIISGDLIYKLNNYFPLEIEPQLYFLDSTFTVIDSLFTTKRIIGSGKVNRQGRVVEPSNFEFSIFVSGDRFETIKSSRNVIVFFRLNTPNKQVARFFTDYRLNLKLIGDLQVEIDTGL